jgi:O-antigen biosynthesis protein WbqP
MTNKEQGVCEVSMYKKYIKRLLDVVLSLAGLIFASWLYVIIMVAIFIDDPGPVFFTQKRVGKDKTAVQLLAVV